MKPTKEQFISDMAEFVQEGIWNQFLAFVDERGVSSKLAEKWVEEIAEGDLY